ncbi:MAG TPA: hypothetical protein VJA21_02010 [Verrucomicrobiae bacterium]
MRAIIAVLAISTGLLVAMSVAQWRQKAKLTERLNTATQESDQKTKQLEELKTAQVRDEQQQAQLLHATADVAEQVRTQQVVATAVPTGMTANTLALTNGDGEKAGKAGLGNFLSKMMEDPDTKKFIRDQQRMMMDQMYAPLIKRLGLTAAEGAQLKDLLAENAMKMAEKATSMFGNAGADRAELANTMAAGQKDFDEQIKGLLGEDRFTQYKEYEETVGDRTQLTLFKQQFSSSDSPISDGQSEQLLALIQEERRSVAATTGQSLPGSGQDQRNLEAMFSPEQADQLLQSQETVNQRVFERARAVLSPDQLQSFGAFQTNQLQMMRMGMNMARKFISPEQTQTTAPLGGETPGN